MKPTLIFATALTLALIFISPSSNAATVVFDSLNGETHFDGQYTIAQVYYRPDALLGYIGMAMAFTLPEGNYKIDSIKVPIFKYEGVDGLSLHLYSDAVGLPGEEVFSFSLNGDWPSYYSERPLSLLTPSSDYTLTGGHQYWIVAEVDSGGADSVYRWYISSTERTTDSAWDINPVGTTPTGDWELTTNPPDLGLTVYASVVPEPSLSLQLLTGLFVISTFIYMRRKKAEQDAAANP